VALDGHEAVSARALRFAILTAARTSEALNATWGEISLDGPDGPLWTIPAARMKGGREHRVPLSDAAVATLCDVARLRAHDDPAAAVFPGQRPGTASASVGSGRIRCLRRCRLIASGLTLNSLATSLPRWPANNAALIAETRGSKQMLHFRPGRPPTTSGGLRWCCWRRTLDHLRQAIDLARVPADAQLEHD
jgi:hypothetical protein